VAARAREGASRAAASAAHRRLRRRIEEVAPLVPQSLAPTSRLAERLREALARGRHRVRRGAGGVRRPRSTRRGAGAPARALAEAERTLEQAGRSASGSTSSPRSSIASQHARPRRRRASRCPLRARAQVLVEQVVNRAEIDDGFCSSSPRRRSGQDVADRRADAERPTSSFSVRTPTGAAPRPRRNGVDYHFVDDATFLMRSRGEFLESAECTATVYDFEEVISMRWTRRQPDPRNRLAGAQQCAALSRRRHLHPAALDRGAGAAHARRGQEPRTSSRRRMRTRRAELSHAGEFQIRLKQSLRKRSAAARRHHPTERKKNMARITVTTA